MKTNLPQKRYYTIGEVAKAFGMNTSAIRYWEKEFDVLKPKKNAKGDRKFTPDDIKNLELIYFFVKEKGFTLEGAKQKIKEQKVEALSRLEIIKKLKTIKETLLTIKKEL